MKSKKLIHVFDGATAIITGGASGIGRALAEELSNRGCRITIADLQIELAKEVISGIKATGGKTRAVKIDVTDFSAVKQLIQETIKESGRIDFIFNNAGIGIFGFVNHYSIDDWNDIVDTNLRGVINGIQAVYPVMIKQGFGHIVNTASMAGLIPQPGNVGYATTKHAIVGLSISLRAEAANKGVCVSVLCPGFIRTPLLKDGKSVRVLSGLSDEKKQQLCELIEKSHPMPPNVFAKKALDLVAKNKAIIVLPTWYKSIWWMNRFFPSKGILFARNQFQRMEKAD